MLKALVSLLLSAVASYAAAQSNAGALPRGAMLIEPEDIVTEERAKAAEVDDAVKAAIGSSDVAVLAAMLDPAATEPLSWEWRTQRTLDLLRAGGRLAEVEAALVALTQYAPRVYMRHPETAADYFVPVFDVAGRAAGTLALWRWPTEPSQAKVANALASRDPSAWRAALATIDGPAQLHLVRAAPATLGYRDALALLESLLADPVLGSTALTTLAAAFPYDAAVNARIRSTLADASLGATAAALLARRSDAAHVATLQSALATSASVIEQRHLLLALRLIGPNAAKGGALAYRARVDADPALSAAVASW